jgi:sugar phosphate isomerase/epimerase
MARIPIAVQLWSVKEQCNEDFAGTLEAIAEMGYDGVELAGFHGQSPADVKAMVEDAGLAIAGHHLSLARFLGDELEPTIEADKILGNRYLICAWVPPADRETEDGLLALADRFNDIAGRLAAHGMRFGYHNHLEEFQPMADGRLPWDVLFDALSEEVIMQVDTGNAMAGGGDPLGSLERFPGRAVTVHLKEHSATNDQPLVGEGDVPWQDVFRLCETVGGTEWYIVEQERYPYPPMESIARCLKNLRAMGK